MYLYGHHAVSNNTKQMNCALEFIQFDFFFIPN